jgi:hypothetical protein
MLNRFVLMKQQSFEEEAMKDIRYAVSLTQCQRIAIGELFPQMLDRLQCDAKRQIKIAFTPAQLKAILWCVGEAIPTTDSGRKRHSLRCIVTIFQDAIRDAHGIGAIPRSKRLYQFKITLQGIDPPIWRRIQTKDCSVDKLHEHIQTAMGWTNSHLHRFEILGMVHGDPVLLCGNPDCFVGVNSLETRISSVVPESGIRFGFSYEYDFGDRWRHEVLFEGCLAASAGVRYPLCLEGERACPPEDVGGVGGYEAFLEVVSDPGHEEYEEWMQWAGSDFDPTHFDPVSRTKAMQRGVFDWRRHATPC